jgi:hypothetical protein
MKTKNAEGALASFPSAFKSTIQSSYQQACLLFREIKFVVSTSWRKYQNKILVLIRQSTNKDENNPKISSRQFWI